MAIDLQRAAHSFSPAGAELCWQHAPTWQVDRRSLSEHLSVFSPCLITKGCFTVFILHTKMTFKARVRQHWQQELCGLV